MSMIEEAKKIIEELEKLKEPDGSIIIEHNGIRYKILVDGEK